MEKQSNTRLMLALLAIFAMFSVLIYSLVNLQLTQGEVYQASAGNSSIKTIRTVGKRGMITDADSVILAMSEDIYNVTFYRNASSSSSNAYLQYTKSIISAIDIIEKYGGELCVTFVIQRDDNGLWEYNFGSGISESAWNTRLNQWRSNHYLTSAKYDDPAAAYEQLYKRYQFARLDEEPSEEMILKVMAVYSEMQMNLFNSLPITIARDVSYSTVSEIEGRSMVLTGFEIEVGSKRVYPRNNLASNIIGYVGPISSYETYYSTLKSQGYQLTDNIGKDGIEKSMESWLSENISSRSGTRVMEKDSSGQLTRELSSTEASDGNTVKLTIIASYQQAAERAIANNVENTRDEQERKMADDRWLETNKAKIDSRDWETYNLKLANTGVLLILDVDNGNVLAMAQYPTYDLNALVAGGDEAAAILLDTRNIMLNYAIQQRAEPGSTFKMVTALAAMVNKVISQTDTINDEGPFMRYTQNEADAPVCWVSKAQRYIHRNQTVIEGLSHSCNYFFYELGSRLYGENSTTLLYQYSVEMGLTSKTGIDLPGEMRGVVGNQAMLYDPTVSLTEQATWQPTLVAASIKKHLISVGESNGISYDNTRLDICIKALMDMAVSYSQNDWVRQIQIILMNELNMKRETALLAATVSDIYNYLNDIKWGGSMEIQTAIGQGITLVTPVEMVRYIASLGNGGRVWNLNIIDSIISPEGEILSKRSATLYNTLKGVDEYLPYIKAGMEGVVDEEEGTASKYFKGWKYSDKIWAKTGTSQVTIGGVKIDLENNAWFCALTPFDQAELAIVCFIPNGYSGGHCSLAVKDFISWWMEEQEKDTGETAVVPGNQLMP